MNVKTLFGRYPIPSLVTTAFLLALVTSGAYFAGLVPFVPKTLPMFATLMTATGALLVATVAAWAVWFVPQVW